MDVLDDWPAEGPAEGPGEGPGEGVVVFGLPAVGAVVLGVVEAAGAFGGFGAAGGRVAFGSRDSTRVFSRFTSSNRSFLLAPSFMDCTVLLTSAS